MERELFDRAKARLVKIVNENFPDTFVIAGARHLLNVAGAATPICPKCKTQRVTVNFHEYVSDTEHEDRATCRRSSCVHSGPLSDFLLAAETAVQP